ncbi:hypothetical protein [Chryseobacterium sp. CCH4-E10]|jgi:hypothetical protein|uniref:hypothetical protein n=1 Tax=Chryseobacterium sp. CCH4-E10 TaxID=1768758 RepID=UPI0008331699|nr:hypothetical protein [Chryseobacterium sp. CCH4-E10]
MALNDAQFINGVVQLQTDMETKTDRSQAKQEYAEKLLMLIKQYLKSGTVTITGTNAQGAFTGTGTIN